MRIFSIVPVPAPSADPVLRDPSSCGCAGFAGLPAAKGSVEWFNATVTDPSQTEPIAHAIDALTANSPHETVSQSENAFFANLVQQFADIGLIVGSVICTTAHGQRAWKPASFHPQDSNERTTKNETADQYLRNRQMRVRKCLVLLGVVAVSVSRVSGTTQAESIEQGSKQCEALESTDFSQIPDALTQVIETHAVSASAAGAPCPQISKIWMSDAYSGSYRVSADHHIGISRFIMDNGENALLIADYSSSIVRRLFPVSSTEFVMGEGFNSASPVALNISFVKDKKGVPTGISMRRTDGTEQFAPRVPLKREEVSFQGADAKLSGTLFMPAAKGPHPAIILLHGSGPLTRYSFGPYPHFFTSVGYAVLIYDKRGSGASTGVRTDASTGAAMTSTFYPDELARDALAAFRFLQQRQGIDPKRIGFWGSSEGGMLAIQAAGRSKAVAFAINSSGFMGPLWETLRYQPASALRSSGASEATIGRQSALVNLWLEVARTGKGWEQFQERRQEAVQADGFWFFQSRGDPTSVEQVRWDWDHVLSFDSLPALENVDCPVLAVFGGLDVLTEATKAEENMKRVFTRAGHKNFTIKIFPTGSHSLMEMPSKNHMAPGVFATLRSWLLDR